MNSNMELIIHAVKNRFPIGPIEFSDYHIVIGDVNNRKCPVNLAVVQKKEMRHTSNNIELRCRILERRLEIVRIATPILQEYKKHVLFIRVQLYTEAAIYRDITEVSEILPHLSDEDYAFYFDLVIRRDYCETVKSFLSGRLGKLLASLHNTWAIENHVS